MKPQLPSKAFWPQCTAKIFARTLCHPHCPLVLFWILNRALAAFAPMHVLALISARATDSSVVAGHV